MKTIGASIQHEKERLDEMKNELMFERQRNSELAQRIGLQTREMASTQVERDMLKRENNYNENQLQRLT